MAIEHDLSIARTHAARCAPNSPSWSAAIDLIVDLERQLWVVERMIGEPGPALAPPRNVALEPELALVTAD